MKKYIYNSDIASGKRGQNMYWVKKDLFGCFRIEENARNTIKQVWYGERRNRNVNYSAFHIRDARSLRLKYLPVTSGAPSQTTRSANSPEK